VIDDLLLLARMDAGHLRLESKPVNMSTLIDEWIDDLSAIPDSADLTITKHYPKDVHICGERQYTSLIVQNLLENARKYNRPGGRIEISLKQDKKTVAVNIGNTGRCIPLEAQKEIFERFHRPGANQSIPGHGLGLSLARELVRLHGGNLRLVRSEGDWTEFEVRFSVAEGNTSDT
jgi:signal transduction histidine kinase